MEARNSKRRRLNGETKSETIRRSTNIRSTSNIQKLPDAVLGIIFEYAVTLREGSSAPAIIPSVCQRWRGVCKEMVRLPSLRLDYKLDGKIVCPPNGNAQLKSLFHFRGVDEARIVGYEIPNKCWSPRGATLTSEGLSNLLKSSSLRDADAHISDSLWQLLQPEMGIKTLSLITSYRSHAKKLVGQCDGLEALELGCGSVGTMGKLYERMMLEARADEERETEGTGWDSDDFDDYMYDEDDDSGWTRANTSELINDDILAKILSGCFKLTRLKLGNFHNRDVCTDLITGIGIQGCPNLVRLDISECDSINDQGIDSICRSCPRIQHLTMGSDPTMSEHANVMTDMGFQCISSLSDLEILEIGSIHKTITARSFEAVLTKCLKLSELKFSDERCEPVSEAFKILAEAGRTAPNLTKVKLLQGACISVSDIARFCPMLKELECDACDGPAQALRALAQGCPGIESLRLAFWEQDQGRVRDIDVQGLAEGCKHLKTLHINGDCHRVGCDVTDFGLKAILEACEGLTSIRLPGPSLVTDLGLFYISRRVQGMKSLDLRLSPGISIAGIVAVLNGCPLMERFEVDVPEKWVEVLKGNFPQLGGEWPQSQLPFHSLQ